MIPGRPALPIARPTLGDAEAAAVAEVLASGWVGQGPRVAALEARLAAFLGAPEVVVVSSGTAALHLALLALGVGPGDEVIVPSLSFVATANAVRHAVATPVFAEVEADTLNLDPADVARRITARTRVIMVVHQLGYPADLPALLALAHAHGLPLLEDAACALGSTLDGVPLGRPHGVAACFSFHPRKVITTGEGGAVTTADPALAEAVRRLRNHGASPAPGGVAYDALGYNFRMSDLQAAVGGVQMDRLAALVARRRALAARYDARIGSLPGIALPRVIAGGEASFQSYHLRVTPECPRTVAEIATHLGREGIATRPGLTAIHREPLYARDDLRLPATEALSREGLFLPLYPDLGEDDVDRVCDAFAEMVPGTSN
jgi:perosamine synthetase